MKPLLVTCLCGIVSSQSPTPGTEATHGKAVPGFRVHEWGTFTSMQGSDGLDLNGLHWAEEPLPDFVHARDELTHGALRVDTREKKRLDTKVFGVNQKMETPVLYFHTDRPLQATVRVQFPNGVISEWFPRAVQVGPGLIASDKAIDIRRLTPSFLQWHVDVIPGELDRLLQTEPRLQNVPRVPENDPWQFAREVDAAWVVTASKPPDGDPAQAERYLFYRGLGQMQLPVQVRTRSAHRGEVRVRGERLPFAVVVEVDGQRGRFQVLGNFTDQIEFDLANQRFDPLDISSAALAEVVQRALVTQRLHADEAHAMVRTWSRSWWQHSGLRLLYLLPRASIDQMLPLQIEPKPAAIERAMLGRIEMLSPDVEAQAERMLAAGDDQLAARFGRFTEPVLRRLLTRSKDPQVVERATARLKDLASK